MLENLFSFVASHDFVNPHIDGDAVVFGVEAVWPDGRVEIQWERVSTLSQARDAMGY